MRQRKLTPDEAFEEYLVYQIRLFEYMEMFQVELDICEGSYKPKVLGHGQAEFSTTVRTYLTGIFASMVDVPKGSLNVFDVWLALYPEDRKDEILRVWKAIESTVDAIREYRNKVAFHASKSLKEYLKVRGSFFANRKDVIKAMQEFLRLAETLMRAQGTILGFETRLDRALKTNFPDENAEKLQQLKQYFIIG
ncbi:MAG: hypothetical protein ACLQOO_24625 [Terriglobia bacterium]